MAIVKIRVMSMIRIMPMIRVRVRVRVRVRLGIEVGKVCRLGSGLSEDIWSH